MAVSVTDSQQRSKLNCIASVSKSPRMFVEEESKERTQRSNDLYAVTGLLQYSDLSGGQRAKCLLDAGAQ